MAASGARMRLTVDVLPLAEENSHGPYREIALAAFKGRKFALPVQLEHTLDQVWVQIEERYKRNYLTPLQAASFTIKKLQDAYDCDLDLSDTVSSIFEGETDPEKRAIKVVPSFVNRDFSVPLTSNLRPVGAQKRQRETSSDNANKRRRLEERALLDATRLNLSRDQPLPSTESAESPNHPSRRSKSRSVVYVQDSQTGHKEFSTTIKEESPELGEPTIRASYTAPESDGEHSQSSRKLLETPSPPAHTILSSQPENEPSGIRLSNQSSATNRHHVESTRVLQTNDQGNEDVTLEDGSVQGQVEPGGILTSDSTALIYHRQSSLRPDVYDILSPVQDLRKTTKPLRTYSKRFVPTPKLVHRDHGSSSRSYSRSKSTQEDDGISSRSRSSGAKSRSFKSPKTDAIASTSESDEEELTRQQGRPKTVDAVSTVGNNKGGLPHSKRTESPPYSRKILSKVHKMRETNANQKATTRVGHDTTIARANIDKSPASNVVPKTTKALSLKKPSRKSYFMPTRGEGQKASAVSPVRKSSSDTPKSMPVPGGSGMAKAEALKKQMAEQKTYVGQDRAQRSSPRVVIPRRKTPLSPDKVFVAESLPQGKGVTDAGPASSSDDNLEHSSQILREQEQAASKEARQLSEVVVGSNVPTSDLPQSTTPPGTPTKDDTLPSHQSHDVTTNGGGFASGRKKVIEGEGPFKRPAPKEKAPPGAKASVSLNSTKDIKQAPSRSIPKTPVPLPNISPAGLSIPKHTSDETRQGSVRRTPVPLPNIAGSATTNPSSSSVDKPSNGGPAKKNRLKSKAKALPQGRVGNSSFPIASLSPAPQPIAPERSDTAQTFTGPISAVSASRASSSASKSKTTPAPISSVPRPAQQPHSTSGAVLSTLEEEEEGDEENGEDNAGDHDRDEAQDQDTEQELQTQLHSDQVHAALAPHRKGIQGSRSPALSYKSQPDVIASVANEQLTQANGESKSRRSRQEGRDPSEVDDAMDIDATPYSTESHENNDDFRRNIWDSEKWGFGALSNKLDTTEKANGILVPPSSSESSYGSQEHSEAEGRPESRSVGSDNSSRPSPEDSRPGRFLSHTPTPQDSSSEVESREPTPSPGKLESNKISDSDMDDSSADTSSYVSRTSSGESDDENSEDDDVDMRDNEVETAKAPPSSPPPVPSSIQRKIESRQAASQTIQPPTSQSLPRSSQVFNPTTKSGSAVSRPQAQSAIRSSQPQARLPASKASASARRPYQKFPNLRQQLEEMKAAPAAAQRAKAFDPSTQSLGSLIRAKKGARNVHSVNLSGGSSDDDEDEDDSSGSSGDEELDHKSKAGAGCSVA